MRSMESKLKLVRYAATHLNFAGSSEFTDRGNSQKLPAAAVAEIHRMHPTRSGWNPGCRKVAATIRSHSCFVSTATADYSPLKHTKNTDRPA
jgi:hypothetical protein